MGRELPPADDIGVLWFGHGVELARRMEALADELRDAVPQAAEAIDDVLTTEYNPLKLRPDLGPPPTVRPGRSLAAEPGS